MAVTLTIGTNTYIDTEAAQAYFDERLGTAAWDNADDTDKAKALAMACKSIEQLNCLWEGGRVSATQPLNWPREYVPVRDVTAVNEETFFVNGTRYYADEYPPPLVQAQCEEALALLEADSGASSMPEIAALDHAAGVAERRNSDGSGVKYFSKQDGGGSTTGMSSGRALQLLNKLMRKSFAGVSGL